MDLINRPAAILAGLVALLAAAVLGFASQSASAAGSDFNNVTPFSAPGDNVASSTITVAGQPTLNDVNVTLFLTSQQFGADDIEFLLQSPTGVRVPLMSDAGGFGAFAGVTVGFDDAASAAVPDGGPFVSGTFKPSAFDFSQANEGVTDAPFPAFTDLTLAAFNGTDPNGTWTLFIADDVADAPAGDPETSVQGGWSLNLNPAAACNGVPATIVGTDGDDTLTGTAGPDVIAGKGGNDKINGLEGDDILCGGDGKDKLKGGKGKDFCLGEAGKDKIRKCEKGKA